MRVKLVAANGEIYLLPDGFMVKDIPKLETSLNIIGLAGRDGGVIDTSSATLKEREIEITGRLMDPAPLLEGDLQEARASAVAQYFALMAFASKSRALGPMRVYRENGIELDPTGESYDASLEPLGYYLNAWFKGGTSGSFFGSNVGGGVVDVALRFIAPRPYWQGLTKKASTSGTIGNSQSVSVSFVNDGTANCRPVFVIAPASELAVPPGKVIRINVDGTLTASWSGTIAAGSVLIFDTATRQVYTKTAASLPENELPAWDKASATNMAGGLVDITDWAAKDWTFDTGDHLLTVDSDSETGAAVVVEARHTNEYAG